MNLIFFLMSPFFFLSGLFFMIMSFLFCCLNFSVLISWNMLFSNFILSFPLYFDFISCFFISMVLIISSSIFMYSEWYMSSDFFKPRFFFLMFFFVMSMVFLVLSPNMFCMLLGWDGLGLVSFCLVVYYQSFNSFCSGFLTALTNRLGDVLILCSLSMCFSHGSWSYMNFLYWDNWFFLMLFFLASMTKSAQIPFSSWLPAAMAAPTPVSSLVHSSTLVTAGVYIMIRFHYLLDPFILNLLMFISLLTMIMAGISGVFEYDLKKIIALSTLSQLGFMMASLSLSFVDFSFFHLVTHASFKALLFMCAGMFIHSSFNNQDIRFFGYMPKDYLLIMCMFNVGNLSLCGFPFLSGFFSKDLILEMLLMGQISFLYFFLFCFGTFLTVLYSLRLFFYMSFKYPFSFSSLSSSLYSLGVHLSMFFLFLFSVSLGYLGSNFFLFPLNYVILPFIMKTYVLSICFVSFVLSLMISFLNILPMSHVLNFFYSMWFLSFLKTDFLNRFLLPSFYKFSHSSLGFSEYYLGYKVIMMSFKNFVNLSSSLLFIFCNFFFFFFLVNCLMTFWYF